MSWCCRLILLQLILLEPAALLTSIPQRSPNIVSFLYDFMQNGQALLDLEARDSETNLLSEYDFIIVGAGTAGCALAARLSEVESWSVLLLEAGGPELMSMDIPILVHLLQANPYVDWDYRTQPSQEFCLGLKKAQCHFPRGKVMGGSSVLNYMIYTRGNRRDYDEWAALGNEGWSYEEVLPYFKKLEDSTIPNADEEFVGHKGPVKVSYAKFRSPVAKAFVQAAQEEGKPYVDYNGKRQVGVSFIQTNTDQAYRWSSNRAYLYPLKGKRPNLHIHKYSWVTKILIDAKTKSAYGVQFESNGKTYKVKARKEVISSAGAINTPQILMLSGVGPAGHLRELGIEPLVDLAVGFNLQDHLAPGFNMVTNETTIKLNDLFNVQQYMKLQTHNSLLSLPGGVEAIAFYDLEHPSDPDGWPDLELIMSSGSFNSNPAVSRGLGIKDDIFKALYEEATKRQDNLFMIFPMLLRPRSKGRILLQSLDPKIHPLIYPNYLKDSYDMDLIVKGFGKIVDLLKQPAMRRINATLLESRIPACRQFNEITSRAYLECYVRQLTFTIYHQSGTAKMGPQADREAVVDSRLRVYGIQKLRVVDASIMPKIVAAHPNSAVYMIAEKAADMIKQDYGEL